MPTLRKRQGLFVSQEFVKPAGFDILLPKGSKSLAKASQITNKQKAAQLALEKEAMQKEKLANEQATFHAKEKRLAKALQDRTMVFRGSNISWYTVKGIGNKVQVYFQQNRRSKPKLVRDFPLFVKIVERAIRESGL